MTILGISEIVLNVDDLPAMREFYQRVLEFELISESCHETDDGLATNGQPTITFLVVAQQQTPLGEHGHPQLLALIDHQRHVFSRGQIKSLQQTNSHLNHLAFEISPNTYDDWLARLEQHDIKTTETEFKSFSAKAIFFQDIEGNRIELICTST